MSMRDLIPWGRGNVAVRRGDDINPVWTLHREMNHLFDDVFRSFDLAALGFGRAVGPKIEVTESDRKVTAELPGHEKVGILTMRGEKRVETEDKDRLFSEAIRSFRATHSGSGH